MALGTTTLPQVLDTMTFGLEIEFIADFDKLLPDADLTRYKYKSEVVTDACLAICDKLLEQNLSSILAMEVQGVKRPQLPEEERKCLSWVVTNDVTVEMDDEVPVDEE